MDAANTIVKTSPTSINVNFAGVGRRWVAAMVDSLIIIVVNWLVSFMVGLVLIFAGQEIAVWNSVIGIFTVIVNYLYYIWMIGKWGQTLGKKLLKIKVVDIYGKAPGYKRAFIREVVGKFVSAIVLLLGYFWAIWDKKKQTWHDKLAQTAVVRA